MLNSGDAVRCLELRRRTTTWCEGEEEDGGEEGTLPDGASSSAGTGAGAGAGGQDQNGGGSGGDSDDGDGYRNGDGHGAADRHGSGGGGGGGAGRNSSVNTGGSHAPADPAVVGAGGDGKRGASGGDGGGGRGSGSGSGKGKGRQRQLELEPGSWWDKLPPLEVLSRRHRMRGAARAPDGAPQRRISMEVVGQTSFDVEPFVAQLLQTQIRRTGGAVLDYDLRVLEPKLRAVDMRGLGGASVAGAERDPSRNPSRSPSRNPSSDPSSDPDGVDGVGQGGAAEQGGVEVTDAELGNGHYMLLCLVTELGARSRPASDTDAAGGRGGGKGGVDGKRCGHNTSAKRRRVHKPGASSGSDSASGSASAPASSSGSGSGSATPVRVGVVFALDRQEGRVAVLKTVALSSSAGSNGPWSSKQFAALALRFAASVRSKLIPRDPATRCLRITNKAVVAGVSVPVLLNPALPLAIQRD